MVSDLCHSEGEMYFKRFEKNQQVSCSSSRAWDERCHYTSIVNLIGHSSYVAKRPQSALLVYRSVHSLNEEITKGITYNCYVKVY